LVEIEFVRFGVIKGHKICVYIFSGNTSDTYEMVTSWGVTLRKRFVKTPYYFATLSPIARWNKVS